MLFAATDYVGIATLITAVCTGVVSVIGAISSALASMRAAHLAAAATIKVDEVSTKQDAHQLKTEETLAAVAANVEEVHKATNGLTAQLVDKTEQEALARGAAEERRQAAERVKNPPVS